MYNTPAEPIAATFTTNAVVNTVTTHTLLAGVAGFRFRIYALRVFLNQNEPAANVFRAIFLLRGVGIWGTVLQVGAIAADGVAYPAPGLQYAAAEAITIVSTCTAVSRPINVQMQIYRDSAT